MKPALLTWLVCPACRGELRCDPTERDGDEILEGHLTCVACGAGYAVTRGVPRMLTRALSPEQERTANAFGFEWHRFDAFHPEYERQFLEWVDPLRPEDFAGKVVLDAGCGMGRHAMLSATFGAAPVIGVDLSAAVDVAYRNTAKLPNSHVVQADICQLPFREPFDLAYSVGVLHHLPDPEQGFVSLASHLRSGGRLAVWVYGAEGNFAVTRLLNPIRLAVTSRLPLGVLHALSWIPAAVAYPALKTVFRAIQRRPALRDRLRWIPYLEYACYLSELGLVPLHSIVFDHLAPEIAYYLTRSDVERWCERAGLVDASIEWHKRYSWRVQGRRPELAGEREAVGGRLDAHAPAV